MTADSASLCTRPRLLLCATGAAAVMSLPSYLITLRTTLTCHLTVAMSAAATQFLPARTVRHVADEVVDGSDPVQSFAVGHMRLAKEADLILVLPATAGTLAAAANGLASDLIPSIILASPKPVIFMPSMHRVMWEKAAMQRNIAQLRADGHDLPEPAWRGGFELADHTVEPHPGLLAPIALGKFVQTQLESRLALVSDDKTVDD